MTNRFEIGDIVSLTISLDDISSGQSLYFIISDIDFTIQKYTALLIGTDATYTYTIYTMDSIFYKVA